MYKNRFDSINWFHRSYRSLAVGAWTVLVDMGEEEEEEEVGVLKIVIQKVNLVRSNQKDRMIRVRKEAVVLVASAQVASVLVVKLGIQSAHLVEEQELCSL